MAVCNWRLLQGCCFKEEMNFHGLEILTIYITEDEDPLEFFASHDGDGSALLRCGRWVV